MIVKGLSRATIEGQAAAHKDWVNASSPKYYDLSPLHVAVIKGDRAAFDVLVANGADLTKADHRGWTALHHAAALGENEMLEAMVEKVGKVAAAELLTDLNGSYLDIQALVNPQFPASDENVCQIDTGDGMRACTGREYSERTGARFCPSVFYESVDTLYHDWKKPRPALQDTTFTKDQIEAHLRAASPLYLDARAPDAPPGIEVRVARAVNRGDLLCCYAGKKEAGLSDDGSYTLNDINGRVSGNLGTRVNCGFGSYPESVAHRGTLLTLLVADQNLQPGDAVRFNYGPGYVLNSKGPLSELNGEALLRLWPDNRTMSKEDFNARLCAMPEALQDYILTNPIPIVYLCAKRVLNPHYLEYAYRNIIQTKRCRFAFDPRVFQVVKGLMNRFDALPERELQAFREQLLKWQATLSPDQIRTQIYQEGQ